MCSKKTVQRLYNIFGMGCFAKKEVLESRKTQWAWDVWSQNALEVLKLILPYSVAKRREILAALEWEKIPKVKYCRGGVPPEILKMKHDIYLRLQELKNDPE